MQEELTWLTVNDESLGLSAGFFVIRENEYFLKS